MTSFGLRLEQHVRAEPHLLERAGAEALDEHVGRRHELEQQISRASGLRSSRHRLFLLRA